MIKELYKKVYKKDSDKIFRYVSRPMAFIFFKPLTYLPVTANQVSIFSILLALACAVLISFSSPRYSIIACIILQVVLILDCVDGMIARYRENLTKYGQYMEFLFHEIVPPSIVFALGVNSYKYLNSPIPLYLGGLTVLSMFFMIVSTASKERIVFYHVQKTKKIPKHFEPRISKHLNKSPFGKLISMTIFIFSSPGYFFTILLVLAIFNKLYYAIFFYSAFYLVIAMVKVYIELKRGFKPYGLE